MTVRPLAGVRVLDVAGEPLASAGRILADLGADVVLVEPPGGSPARRVPPLLRTASGEEVSPHFAYTAAGKRSIILDVDSPSGYELLCRLVGGVDVVLVSDLPETLRLRKLDYLSLRSINDRIILTSLTPFGTIGPQRRWRGSDLVAWASSGALASIGDADRGPVAPGGRLAYAAGSLNAVAGTVLALQARERTGRGQMVDISLQEAVLSVTMENGPLYTLEGGSQARVGHRRGPAQGRFTAKDGFVEVDAYMPGQWDAMAQWIKEELGIEEATMETFRGSRSSRIPFQEMLNAWVDQLTARYLKQEFFVEAQRRLIPSGPVNEPSDLLTDPQLEAVDGWVQSDYPGLGPLRQPRAPLRFGSEPLQTGPVPRLGQHDNEVYRDDLGLTAAEVASLLNQPATDRDS
jgi:benzylsuccinate CoA-transferase BbsE subunit